MTEVRAYICNNNIYIQMLTQNRTAVIKISCLATLGSKVGGGHTINMNPFQLPCSSTFDFIASMRVVYAVGNSFAGFGGIPKSPRSKVRMRRVLNVFMFDLKSECSPAECICGTDG